MNVALHPHSLDFISLCTGGGGLDLGVELAVPSARAVCMVEGEAWSVATLVSAMEARLLAPAPVWSNVRTFDGRPWRGLVDGLIGGIPCQPHSLAGRRKGANDERDLWSPTRRIIVQARPWFVLIENVRGMLSASDGQIPGAKRVWRDLQRLGYEVEFGIFTAEEVGAPHQRERVFILAVAHTARGGSWPRFGESGPFVDGIGAAGLSGDVGNADCLGLEGWRYKQRGRAGELPARPNGGELADADGERRAARCAGGNIREGRGALAQSASRPLANAGRERDQRQRGAGDILCSSAASEGEGDQRERDGSAARDGGEDVVDPTSNGRREGRTEPDLRRGRPATAGASADVVDAVGSGHDGQPEDEIGGPIGRTAVEWSSRESFPRLYPPGPSDLDGWRGVLAHSPELEPAVRRMADGVAARLDLAGPHAACIERLRMLGNGVVPLEAAYALRALAARLARRSAGADTLIRMMEL